jgi:hypothetical protein
MPGCFDFAKNDKGRDSFVQKVPHPQAILHSPKDTTMIRIKLLLTCTFLFAALPALADQVTCESINNRRAECDMNTRGEVRLVRQLSRATCIENTNWGANRSSIWVDRGCAGVFASGDSLNNGSAGASSGGGVGSDQVTCESVGGRRVECDMNTSGRVVVVRQLSNTRCIENTNWGANRSSIWVDRGCRAVFAREGADGGQPSRTDIAREDAQYDSSGRAPAAAIRACNKFADQGYDGTIVSQNAMKPGRWEVVLRFEQYRYACNVSNRGQVESFNKIN